MNKTSGVFVAVLVVMGGLVFSMTSSDVNVFAILDTFVFQSQTASTAGSFGSDEPVITIKGADPLYLTVGQNFNAADPGVTTFSSKPAYYLSGVRRDGGNINSGWDVDTSKPATLTVTYRVTQCLANGCGWDPSSTVVGSSLVSRQVIITAPAAIPTDTPQANMPIGPIPVVDTSPTPTVPTPVVPVVPIATTTPLQPPVTMLRADSCSAADVQKKLNEVAAEESTVIVPEGDCIWTTPVRYNQKFSTILQGAGGQTPAGGMDKTIITDGVNHDQGSAMLTIVTANGKAFRMTGFSFKAGPTNKTVAWNGMIAVYGSSKAVRIDHNHVYSGNPGASIALDGFVYGVLDHNLMEAPKGIVNNFVRFSHSGWNNDPVNYGHASWADDSYFGSNKFIFAEGNTFNGSWAVDCSSGGRFVFRYNTLNRSNLQTHGLSPDVRAGCRAMEIYGNTFTYSTTPISDMFAFTLMLESGTGMFWNNTITGYTQFIHEATVRTSNTSYTYAPAPKGWGYCGTKMGPSPWDGNTDATGYPCFEQVGRGKGDLVTGTNFPNMIHSSTGTTSQTHQALEPVYVWNNMYNPVPQQSHDALWGNGDSVTVENRDYYLQLPNYNEPTTAFTGAAGVGSGLLFSRPATCTPGVGYWASDKNTLYRCSAQNTWEAYYTPYSCPNPLITTGFTADPSDKIDTLYCQN